MGAWGRLLSCSAERLSPRRSSGWDGQPWAILGTSSPSRGPHFSLWAGALHTEAAPRISASGGRTWEVRAPAGSPCPQTGGREAGLIRDPQKGWGEGPLHPDSSWASPGHAQAPPPHTSRVWRLGGGLTPLDGLREGTGAAGLQEEMCESSARVYSAPF